MLPFFPAILHWQLVDKDVPSFGFSSDVFWFRLKLKNSLNENVNLMLSVESPVLDDVRFFVNDQGNQTQFLQMGDAFPYNSRVIFSPNFVLPLDFQPQEQVTIYLRVESQSAIQVPIKLAVLICLMVLMRKKRMNMLGV